jgi:lysozyme
VDIYEQLTRDEGLRLKPYQDTVGKTTIGVGRNLSVVGISEAEAQLLLANDVGRVNAALLAFGWFTALDPVRQGAIINMAFNLGVNGLMHFPHMLAALQFKDWITAASEMTNSVWAQQVGPRAQRLEQQILTGEWQ